MKNQAITQLQTLLNSRVIIKALKENNLYVGVATKVSIPLHQYFYLKFTISQPYTERKHNTVSTIICRAP